MDLLRGVGKGMGSLGKGVVSGAGSLVGVKNKASKDIAIPTIETNDYFEASQFFPHIVSNLQMLPQLSGEGRNQKLREVEQQIKQAGFQLSDPALVDQLRSLPSMEAQRMSKEVEDKQRHLIALQEWFEEEVKGLSPKGPRSPQDVAKETKAEQKNALLSSHEKSNTCIKSSKRAPDETQIASSGSLPELQRPWVKATIMQHSQQTLGETNGQGAEPGSGKPKKKFLGLF